MAKPETDSSSIPMYCTYCHTYVSSPHRCDCQVHRLVSNHEVYSPGVDSRDETSIRSGVKRTPNTRRSFVYPID